MCASTITVDVFTIIYQATEPVISAAFSLRDARRMQSGCRADALISIPQNTYLLFSRSSCQRLRQFIFTLVSRFIKALRTGPTISFHSSSTTLGPSSRRCPTNTSMASHCTIPSTNLLRKLWQLSFLFTASAPPPRISSQ